MSRPKHLPWRVHTPSLLREILNNNETQALRIPISILAALLEKVATRASQLNDKELNALMLRLTLYSMADPESENYNSKVANKLMAR